MVNNVETFSHIPWIIERGAQEYASLGTTGSPGTKIFTLSGDIQRPGYYELEMGKSLRTLIDDFGGGMVTGKSFQAALVGGAAGTFVNHSLLDTPMTFDDLQAKGAVLGSGAVIVLADDRPLSASVGMAERNYAMPPSIRLPATYIARRESEASAGSGK